MLAYLSKRLTGSSQGGGSSVLTDLLGGMLGRGGAGQVGLDTEPDRSGSGSILDMLGGMLGGGRR